jgi:transcriptional regulator of acetoin/glycerol metabolism
MKHDMNDLKSLVFELIRNNDLQVADNRNLNAMEKSNSTANGARAMMQELPYSVLPDYDTDEPESHARSDSNLPVIIPPQLDTIPGSNGFNSVEILDENLRLEDHEKNLITKALRKFKGRRKEAAQELGISERTLYRKIKQYNL